MNRIENLFQQKSPEQLTNNFFQSIGDDWMLITAGNKDKFNTMTASWGAVGILWNKPIAICFIRPTRYTFEFAIQVDVFTLSFFNESNKSILNFCGSRSGRNVDKIKTTGLKPLLSENGGITYEQARLCIECKKIYYDDLNPEHFLKPDTDDKFYPNKDYHRMFIGEILACYIK